MSDLNEIIPVENADARKDLLSEQFDEVVETTVDDTPEPVEVEAIEEETDEVEARKND
jgi:hypothetical protein